MKRIWVKVAVSIGAVAIIGAHVSACAHNDSSLFIRQVIAPTTPANGICAYTGDISQPSWPAGILDVAFGGSSYQPAFLLGNQIVTQANQDLEQTETSRIIVTGAISRITDLNGNNLPTMLSNMCQSGDKAACAAGKNATPIFNQGGPPNPFSTEETTAIEPSDGTTASYSPISITIVDGATIGIVKDYFEAQNALLPGSALGSTNTIELLTYTKAEGHTLGGDAEESNEFEFPVTLCFGCLASNVVADSASTIGFCLACPTATGVGTGTCIAGQDVPSFINSVPGITLSSCGCEGGVVTTVDAGGDAG